MNDHLREAMLSEAHERSTKALSQIMSHEKLCEERYMGINEKLDTMSGRMWGAAIAIIMLLLSILGVILMAEFDSFIASRYNHSYMDIALQDDIDA